LEVDGLEERYLACSDTAPSRRFQAIPLLPRGHAISQASAMTAFRGQWIEQLASRRPMAGFG